MTKDTVFSPISSIYTNCLSENCSCLHFIVLNIFFPLFFICIVKFLLRTFSFFETKSTQRHTERTKRVHFNIKERGRQSKTNRTGEKTITDKSKH